MIHTLTTIPEFICGTYILCFVEELLYMYSITMWNVCSVSVHPLTTEKLLLGEFICALFVHILN